MAKVTIKDNSKEILSMMGQARERSLEKIGLVAEGYAKKICPVGTPESTGIPGYVGGTARNSITHVVESRAVYIGSNVVYFPMIEFGTRYMRARPTLRPAATEHADEYGRIIKDEYAQVKS